MASNNFFDYFNKNDIDISSYNSENGIIYNNDQPQMYSLYDLTNLIELSDFSPNKRHFDKYIISGDERPDHIAFKQYDDSNLWWLVLLINNMSYLRDYPVTEDQLGVIANKLYKSEYKYNLSTYIAILSEINDKRRHIYLLKPDQVNIFLETIQNRS